LAPAREHPTRYQSGKASDQGGEDSRPEADDPGQREQAHALPTRALSDPDRRTSSQALDDLMRRLVVYRQLEAEERLARREPM
jgi:hypothetical protein